MFMSEMELLFSYGTLQDTPVQIETFGRELEGYVDQLLGYKLETLLIQDQSVVDLSGKTHHPIAVFSMNADDKISGVVFKITKQELAQSDLYEVSDYKRIKAEFKSGKKAWVYVQA
jgi:gamma-glutamylcyclotransferase (GGCT)/AIG2-like uncharacterized protein YtfP